MDLENIRLPGKRKKTKKDSQALARYGRHGRTSLGNAPQDVPPVSLDAEAMQQILQEQIMKEHREKLEQMQEQMLQNAESFRLPQGTPPASLGSNAQSPGPDQQFPAGPAI